MLGSLVVPTSVEPSQPVEVEGCIRSAALFKNRAHFLDDAAFAGAVNAGDEKALAHSAVMDGRYGERTGIEISSG